MSQGEKQQLLEQIRELQAQLARVNHNEAPAQQDIVTQAEQNANAREYLRAQQLSLWGAHSMLSDWLNGQSMNPLSSFIRLTCELDQRRVALESMKQCKVSHAKQFLLARSRFLDLLKPHSREDKGENARGDYCVSRFDIVQFEDVQSVQQVFDALVFYMLNMEIAISEKLGDVTVREDCDLQGPEVIHHRLLSTNCHGVSTELNCASFMQFHHDQQHPDQNYAVLTTDSVDEDELRPYTPATSLRKDITGGLMLTAHRREGELVVVMVRSVFIKLHHPEMNIAKWLLRKAQEDIAQWGDVMIKCIRDQLHPDEAHT